MIYDYKNATGAKVIHMSTGRNIQCVVSIDMEKNNVTRHTEPLRIVDGEVETFDMRCVFINAVFDNKGNPYIFECYPEDSFELHA